MTKPNIVTTKSLTKTYNMGDNAVHALLSCNLEIKQGEKLGIMGASGSGKSTLISIIGGILPASSGEITVCGENLVDLKEEKSAAFRRKNIGFVFQSYQLIPEMTAKQNILFPQKISGEKLDKSYFEELCSNLNISDRLSHLPSELSGGQQQRVAIARALINKPSLLLCDEPTGNLDSVSGEEVIDLLLKTNKIYDCTIVIVTHDSGIAKLMDRVVYIKDGRLTDSEV